MPALRTEAPVGALLLFLGIVLGHIKLRMTVVSADLITHSLSLLNSLFLKCSSSFCQFLWITNSYHIHYHCCPNCSYLSILNHFFPTQIFSSCKSVNIVYLRWSVWTLNISFSLICHSEQTIHFLWNSQSSELPHYLFVMPVQSQSWSCITHPILLISHTSGTTIQAFKFDG